MNRRITGVVVHGDARGRAVGMPTANIMPSADVRLPAIDDGVYAGVITVRGTEHLAVVNIGARPTVDDSPCRRIEAHILDFDADIYGDTVTLHIRDYIRDIKKFPSLNEVSAQVQRDIALARHSLKDVLPKTVTEQCRSCLG